MWFFSFFFFWFCILLLVQIWLNLYNWRNGVRGTIQIQISMIKFKWPTVWNRISRVYIYFSTLETRIDPAGKRGRSVHGSVAFVSASKDPPVGTKFAIHVGSLGSPPSAPFERFLSACRVVEGGQGRQGSHYRRRTKGRCSPGSNTSEGPRRSWIPMD